MKKTLMLLLDKLLIPVECFVSLTYPLFSILNRVIYLVLARSRCKNVIPINTQFDGRISILGTGNIVFGEYCRIGKNVTFETQESGEIILGNFVRINQGTIIVAREKVTISHDSLIGEYCSIRDANHGLEKSQLIRTQTHAIAPILIEENVWIGRGTAVLKGVSISKNAVIGANSVVTKNVIENSINVGNPARFIRER